MGNKIKFRAKEGGGDFTLVPKGTYQAVIVDIDSSLTSKDGDPQIKVTLELGGGSEFDGQKIPHWLTMSDKFGWKVEQLLGAAGIDYEVESEEEGSDGKKIRELSFDPDDLLGCWVQIELNHWEAKKDGKTYHQIDKYDVSPHGVEEGSDGAEASGDSDAATAPASDTEPAKAPPQRRRRPGA